MFACDVAAAFACVTGGGPPGVLIKITSGSRRTPISGALKDDANTSARSWEVGEGGAFVCARLCGRDAWFFFLCVFFPCVCARLRERL